DCRPDRKLWVGTYLRTHRAPRLHHGRRSGTGPLEGAEERAFSQAASPASPPGRPPTRQTGEIGRGRQGWVRMHRREGEPVGAGPAPELDQLQISAARVTASCSSGPSGYPTE